ncbi:MAG: hypothetical protein KAS59_00295, partial [Alphaproteobacteria bacterium]|nr:hypothetical protein [Alphaproteobacteria bacterium]
DNMLSENRGVYHHKGGGKILIYFHELTPALGKAKIGLLKNKMLAQLENVQKGRSDPDQPLVSEKDSSPNKNEQKQPAETNLSRLIKDGLGNNPNLEILTLWMSRVLQNLTMSTHKTPLLREMSDLAIKSNISYLPLWSASAQAIIGSICTVRSPISVNKYDTGEFLRQDLASLFSSCFHLYSMQSKNVQSLIVIPIRITSLNDKNFVELYLTFLHRLDSKIKKNIIFEIKNIPKDNLPATLKETIKTLEISSRAYIFETGILTYFNHSKNFPKLHACGFNAAEGNLSENEKLRLTKKYAEQYAGFGVKTYIRFVDDKKTLATVVKAGFTYISGSIIGAATKTPYTTKKLPLSEIV